MQNIKKYNQVQPAARTRLVTGLKTTALLAPFALSSAFAQDGAAAITAMSGDAKSGAEAVQTGVVALVGIILIISLVIWGAGKLKPTK